MQINIGRKFSEAEWFEKVPEGGTEGDENNPRFKVRLQPGSMDEFRGSTDGTMVLTGKSLCDKFMYCLVGWEKVFDNDDNPVLCSEENKKLVFDYGLGGISVFVNECIAKLATQRDEDSKN